MSTVEPHVREAGAGPAVVCLHSNASHSGQWRDLMSQLSPQYRVLAPDSFGSGQSPDWHSDRVISLSDEVDLLAPVIDRLDAPFFVVGHSYGAAIALKLALRYPGRVRALALYEPTLFSLIDADSDPPNDADGIRDTGSAAAAALDAGDKALAARAFIDYWMGPGSWDRTPPQRQPVIADSVANVRRWGHALFTEPAPLSAFATLDIPVLYMTGRRSTQAAKGVARRLLSVLPQARHLEFEALGHMGPLTHAQQVNEAIVDFMRGVSVHP